MQSHHLVVAVVTQAAVLVAQKAVLHQAAAVSHLEVQVLANHLVAVQVQKIVVIHHQVQLNQVVLVVQAIVVSHQVQVVVKHLVHQAAVHLNQAQEQLAHQVKILMVQFLIAMHLVL